MTDNPLQDAGTIVTFYSYKGGVGRTMALANLAYLLGEELALQRQRVLMLDWDLDAPGLHRYFPTAELPSYNDKPGVIDYFSEIANSIDAEKYEAITSDLGSATFDRLFPIENFVIPNVASGVDLIRAGRFDAAYPELVAKFDWIEFFESYRDIFPRFCSYLASRYRWILIDSRTGLSDVAGICGMVLPEKLVTVFTPNRQSVEGVLDLARRAVEYRIASDDPRPLSVFPLPSRIVLEELKLLQEARSDYRRRFQALLSEVYGVDDCDLSNYFDEVEIPHYGFYGFRELVPARDDSTATGALSINKAYERFFKRLTHLDHAWQALGEERAVQPEKRTSVLTQPRWQPSGGGGRRFRVALCFPGEYRARVERIADALAATLGRERVLYDKWYSAELNRTNLDVYLPKLYHDDADLIAVFLSKEYNEKEWCGLDWRASRDLIKRRSGVRVMFFRLDDADVSGLFSVEGYQDIHRESDADVAVAILSQLPTSTTSAPHRTFISKLPVVNPTLVGRQKEIAFLDKAWNNPSTNFVQIIAAGGTGKTALVDRWFRRHLGEATVFGWSFYSQGGSADRQTSSDPFFADILAWLDIKVAQTASVYAKAEAVARRLREERVLLLLDGVEPLQDATGAMRDLPLKALLQELDTENRGLAVCTTRVRIDIPDEAPRVLSIDLDNLTQEQGAEYLRSLKVEGADEELRQASKEYWNHALALTLLGTYLVDFCDGDIRRRVEIPALVDPDSHAHRVIAAYERMFAGKPELDILQALGYFDHPAELAALKLVLPAILDRAYQAALNRLFKTRMISTLDPTRPLDCHPLVREHFTAAATAEGHGRLYEHYKNQAPQRPDTLVEMTPLFQAVYHGCRAGRHRETLTDVYWERILRRGEFYLMNKIGAWGTSLSMLANFFEAPWARPCAGLPDVATAWLVNSAGSALRAIGRLADAVEPMRAGAASRVRSESWIDAAITHGNLGELLLILGYIADAIVATRQSVEFADRSGDEIQRAAKRAALADAFHQSGELAEARRLFEEAERLQAAAQPGRPRLTSLRGYRYWDLLLGENETSGVVRRAASALRIAERQRGLLDIGLDHLSLGRAHSRGSPEAVHHLDQAVEFLRRAGTLHHLPRALLARGTPHDLDEVFRIASRSGMRLFLADYHLAKGNLAEAERLINATGYHRRDPELAALRAKKVR